MLMYNRSSDVTAVNKARFDLSARKQREYDMPNMLLMRLDTCGDKH